MSKLTLTATFLRSGKGFKTEEKIDGPLGARHGILDRRSRRDVKHNEEWSFHIFGASKVDAKDSRDPVYFVFLVEKIADAPTMKSIIERVNNAGKTTTLKTAATTSDAEARAKSLFAPIVADSKDLASLGKVFARKKAETDVEARAIAGGIGCMEGMLATNRADEVFYTDKLKALITTDFDEGMACAVRVADARREKESLLADGRKYASMRSQAARIKGKSGELPAHLSDEALGTIEQQLDSRRAALKELLADHDGKVDTTLNKLDRDLLNFVDPWWSDRQEARTKVDETVSLVGELARIRKDRDEHLDTLAELVNQYEARLTALIS